MNENSCATHEIPLGHIDHIFEVDQGYVGIKYRTNPKLNWLKFSS